MLPVGVALSDNDLLLWANAMYSVSAGMQSSTRSQSTTIFFWASVRYSQRFNVVRLISRMTAYERTSSWHGSLRSVAATLGLRVWVALYFCRHVHVSTNMKKAKQKYLGISGQPTVLTAQDPPASELLPQ